MKLFGFTRRNMLLIVICQTRANLQMRTYPDFGLQITGFLMGGCPYRQVGRAGNTGHGGAGLKWLPPGPKDGSGQGLKASPEPRKPRLAVGQGYRVRGAPEKSGDPFTRAMSTGRILDVKFWGRVQARGVRYAEISPGEKMQVGSARRI
jgi:hypothetical protein